MIEVLVGVYNITSSLWQSLFDWAGVIDFCEQRLGVLH